MILDEDKYKQEKSPYERPNFPYRCGRALYWGKPCRHGPNIDGTCGGVSECQPFFDNGRWQCRRTGADGPCADGPMPDGQCSQQQPACQPARTIRGIRARAAIAMAAVCIALVAGFSFGLEDGGGFVVDPGPLSGIHSKFTAENGCKSCHAGHGGEAVAVLKAMFSPSGPSGLCVDCHGFGGSPTAAHNSFSTDKFPHSKPTQCVMCHTEHKGVDAKLTHVTDTQCAACHKVKFTSFAQGHPAFSDKFPTRRRAGIAFGHANHFGKYFVDPRYAEKAPKERCIGCHDAAKAGIAVPVKSYAEMCSTCHDNAIAARPLVLFRLPEFSADPFAAATGADADQDFESISLDPLSAVTAYLLKVEPDDAEEYTEPAGQLLRDMKESGADALVQVIKEAGGAPAELLRGLPAELMAAATAAWSKNEEYEPPDTERNGGWFATELTISYQPAGHGDKVMKAWLDFAARQGNEAVREDLMSLTEGPGACIKCHAVSKADASAKDKMALEIEWGAADRTRAPFFAFRHQPHLNLLREGASCETCHQVDSKADVIATFKQHDPSVFASSFASVKKETCAECHGRGSVTATCVQCHRFHNEPSIKKAMGSKITENLSQEEVVAQ